MFFINLKILISDDQTKNKGHIGDEDSHNDDEESSQVGSGNTAVSKVIQSGSGSSRSIAVQNEDEFINKIAILVTKKIQPRLPETIWNNFNLTSPNTSMIAQPNTSPPLHYNNTITKDDENDIYGIFTTLRIYLLRCKIHIIGLTILCKMYY